MLLLQLGFIFSDSADTAEKSGFGWSQVIAFGVVILIMAIMPKLVKRMRRERKEYVKKETGVLLNHSGVRDGADQILVELAEMSREINAQVDTKIRVLNKLIRDAEKVVKRYEELQGNAARPKAKPETVKAVQAPKNKAVSADSKDKAEIKLPAAESQRQQSLKAEVEQENPVGNAADIPANSETGVWQRSVGAKIKELRDKGYEVGDIARKTRMSVAEVTLMLEMFKNQK